MNICGRQNSKMAPMVFAPGVTPTIMLHLPSKGSLWK